MKTRAFKIFVAFLSVIPFCVFSQNGNVSVKASLDSTLLLMGKQTALHLQIVQDKGAVGYFVGAGSDTICTGVDIVGATMPDTTDLKNNRIQIDANLILQSFDSGMYVLPPMQYVVGKDTFKSNQLTLKVLPVAVDSLKTIHDFKDVKSPPFNIFDFIPAFFTEYWWINLIVLILIVVGVLLYLKKKKGHSFMPKKKEVPPYEEALGKLQQLKEMKLWQSGQEKEYYTVLTDILRNYIDRRFDINAMEMTSNEIIDVLKRNDETKAVNEQLQQILEIADFVKFAKVRPLPDDNEASYQRAVRFVEETKPEEPVKEDNAESSGNEEDAGSKNKINNTKND